MTHEEMFQRILNEANLGIIHSIDSHGNTTAYEIKNSPYEGYTGFFSTWTFRNGELVNVGHWE